MNLSISLVHQDLIHSRIITQDKYKIPLQSVGASRAAILARCIENKGSLSYHLLLSTNSYVHKTKKEEAIT